MPKQRVRMIIKVNWFSVSKIHEDMLRYDIAFANPEEFPNVVAIPVFKELGQGRWGGDPTVGRWRSFGIAITPIEEPLGQNLRSDPSKWYTGYNYLFGRCGPSSQMARGLSIQKGAATR